jgi:hypothetical protein
LRIVEEVGRLHWRLLNGKAEDAQIGLDRIHAVTHHFRREPDGRPVHSFRTLLQDLTTLAHNTVCIGDAPFTVMLTSPTAA